MQRYSRRMNIGAAAYSRIPLGDDQLRAVVPSIFAGAAHDSRGPRYTYLPTVAVLQELRREGFEPFYAMQVRVRDEGRAEHTKHMLRLRHRGQIEAAEANEVILMNSHDGTSSFRLISGMIRFVCCNGMVSGDLIDDVTVRHSGNVAHQVVEGAHNILDGFGLVREVRDEMANMRVSEAEQLALAGAALQLRYEPTEVKPAPITAAQALAARRYEDSAPTLWAAFNRLQENLVRGGQPARSAAGRRTATRAVTGIDSDVRLNRALWVLADQLRKHKNGEQTLVEDLS